MNTTEPTTEGGKDWDAKGAMYNAFNVPIDFYLYFKESAIENAKLLTNDKDNV